MIRSVSGEVKVKLKTSTGIVVALGLLAACSPPEYILPGQREALRSPNVAVVEDAAETSATEQEEVTPDNVSAPITLPKQVNHASWTHIGGNVTHQVQHPALAASPQLVWAADIGQGNDRKHRITAEPVILDGRIFTLDSRALVVATSGAGETLWTRDLTPATDSSDDASGGGLAVAGNLLFVTSGFGTLTALDTTTGEVKWQQELAAPAHGAPSVHGGIVYVTTRDDIAWAVEAKTGKVKWRESGTPSPDGITGTSSPAVTDRLVIWPFASGEIVATLPKGGTRTWDALVTGERAGRGYALINDISAAPVVQGNVIYVGNPVGRSFALSLSGKRLWTATEGAISPIWVSGGSAFLISDEAKLVRLDATSGERIWAVDLPYFTKEKVKKRKAIYAHYGPVLAGGKLWVTSSDAVMRGFDPVDGSLVSSIALPAGAATRPAIVNGVAYVVSRDGQLLALR
ncbi:PQQ-binding-like beta-propeller repeat protein [Aliiroseovarius crassostreae]|nr:PQQ-binding-like beta-propeller repeat protein [Aliiroseovarius crassostreae]